MMMTDNLDTSIDANMMSDLNAAAEANDMGAAGNTDGAMGNATGNTAGGAASGSAGTTSNATGTPPPSL